MQGSGDRLFLSTQQRTQQRYSAVSGARDVLLHPPDTVTQIKGKDSEKVSKAGQHMGIFINNADSGAEKRREEVCEH